MPKRKREEPTPVELAAGDQARLVQHWYIRMSGQAEWKKGEKSELNSRIEALSVRIDNLTTPEGYQDAMDRDRR